jgi:hypothetical protein
MRFEFGLNLLGHQTFGGGGDLNNSPKFYLVKVLMNVNLDGLTCMPKFQNTHKW